MGAQLDRPQMELAAEAVKWQEAHAKAAAKLEEQMLDSRAQLQKQMASLEDAKASLQQQHAKETMELRRQLVDVRSELTKTQEEKALIMKRAQEDRSALLRHWHEEVMCLREDKAAVFNTLENEKLSLRRRLQMELTELQQSKEETVAELEREKAVLRDKWQTAMEETGVLQARVMALEERFEDRLRSRTATLEEEKAQIQRQCHDEIGRLLEEKATEVARLTSEKVQLQRRLDETAASMDEEKGAILVQMEAEKGQLQCQLQQVSQEQLRMSEEKVVLAEGQASEMTKAHETWGAAFSRELQASRELQKTEASRLRNLVQTMSERTQASEWQTSLLQAELAILQEHLDLQPTRGVQTPSAVQGSVSCVASVSGSDPSSPNRKASSTEEINGVPPEGKRMDGDVQTETEPEGETTPPEAVQRVAEPPNPTLLRSLPGMWSSPSFKDIKITDRCQAPRIFEVPSPGACGYRFSMNAQEVKKGKKGRKRVTLSGFVSECEVPDFFDLSPGEDLRVTAWSEEQTQSHLDWVLNVNGKAEDVDDFYSDSEPSSESFKLEESDKDGPEPKFEDGHIRANDELAFLNDLDMGEVEDGLLNDLGSGGSLDSIDSLQEG
eukprot:s3956_g5.t1